MPRIKSGSEGGQELPAGKPVPISQEEILSWILLAALGPAVDSLLTQSPVTLDPYDPEIAYDFENTGATIGTGMSDTRSNEHWARDAMEDALSHLLTNQDTSGMQGALIGFTVGNKKLVDKGGKSIKEAVAVIKKNTRRYIRIRLATSVDRSLRNEARVFVILTWNR